MNRLIALLKNINTFLRSEKKATPESSELYQYKYAVDQSCIVVVTDLDGHITYANKLFYELAGYLPGESLRDCKEIIDTGFREPGNNISDTLLKGNIWKGELRGKAKRGASFWMDSSVVPFPDKKGNITQYMIIGSDITFRKAAELKLLLYEQIVRCSEDAIISKDINGFITSWNSGAENILGYTKEEAVGKHISLVIPPDLLFEETIFIESIKADKHIEHFETERVRKDGRRINVSLSVSPVKDISGNIIGGSKILRDVTQKKIAEQKLLESEKKYRSFFEDSPLPMWVTEKDTLCFLDVNETALKEYGYGRDEFLAMTAFDIRDDKEKKRLASLGAPDENSTRNTGIWKHIRKDGSTLLAEVSAHSIMFGNRHARLVMSINVTERETARRLVEQNEMRFRNTLDKMLEGVQIIDFNWRYVYVNEAMARHGKYPREAFSGKTVMEMYPGIEGTDIFKIYQQCFDERIPIHLENFFTFPDGSTGWFELSFLPIPEGLFILSIDITERKKTGEDLIKSERIYRTIASSIPGSIICLLDKDWHYRLVEGDMLDKLGYAKEDILGHPVKEVLTGQRYREIAPDLERVFNGETFTVENVRGEFHILSKFVPLKDQAGEVDSAMIAVFDVTELKQAQQKIEELNQGLEEKIQERTMQLATANKELESFSYSVSHDLRAPLRGIDGWSLALLDDYGEALDANAQAYLKRIRSETQRMGDLIDDLLRLSRVSRTSIKLSTVSLTELANTITFRLREMYPGRQFLFTIQEGLVAYGDAQLLDIMLTNLLGNACKFTGKKEIAEISFGEKMVDGQMTYFIRDNGVGFNLANATKLFGAFQRMHKQSEFPGSGIGLAIVERIVNLHNGTIRAESAPDKGATFYFTIDK